MQALKKLWRNRAIRIAVLGVSLGVAYFISRTILGWNGITWGIKIVGPDLFSGGIYLFGRRLNGLMLGHFILLFYEILPMLLASAAINIFVEKRIFWRILSTLMVVVVAIISMIAILMLWY
ncbi:MAG: hypothetical protein FWE04_01315 [Oscillospiraceae bacterium]|nr:hypothetical protein [Oscillospiraceae bacterium]